jgi:hypothetical protein
MGRQYNKTEKRRRRQDYVRRKKSNANKKTGTAKVAKPAG